MDPIQTAIAAITLPHTQRSLGSEKALVSADVRGSDLHVVLRFAYPAQHLQAALTDAIAAATGHAAANIQLQIDSNIAVHKVQQGVNTIAGVKNIIAVASGKGGVGKSTTTTNLAIALSNMGARVGVLDADIYGPSQPTMLGVAGLQPEQRDGKFIPVVSESGIQTMSIGFMIDTDQAVVWRGPMVSQALQQLLFQSQWDEVDYLFIDLPPGTGDVQLTLSQKIPVTASVIVTTPQDIALLDARKAVDMFNKVNIPILGIVENMAMHVCSNCGHAEAIFGSDGGKALADKLNVPLLAQLPLSLPIREAMDAGLGAQLHAQEHAIADLYQQAAWQVALKVADMGRDFSGRFPKIVVE
ncbi:iron-sulfur cluster carrier protein ApbC [Vitreoscilla massiliensis]|uniref:iron-sulfur cluster carrier protein ApbC n=1 Tax=Vitreoscilla massiliensis TaxID=1689272 RepID=UPI00071C81D3